MNNIILFPHMLGQTKFGVEKTPNLIRHFLPNNKNFFNVKCNNNIFYNLKKLYKTNNKIIGPRMNIGGDHSMSIATVAHSLNKNKNTKLIWIDAHADINTFESSFSKNVHGMPLSFLTGLDRNLKLNFIKNLLPMENILYIGIRDLDPFEEKILKSNKINFITVNEFRSSYDKSFNFIDKFIENKPVHISFDVDSIDPKFISCTGTRVDNGLNVFEGRHLINNLCNHNIVNIDLTELNLNIGNVKQKINSLENTLEIIEKLI